MKTKIKPNPPPEAPKQDIEPDHPLYQPPKFSRLPLFIIVLLLLNLVATCGNSVATRRVARNQPYIYVQSRLGTTEQATPVDPLYRTDEVIAKFTEDWLKLAYTWKTSPEKSGASVNEQGIDFPYPFHAASVAIIPGYREAYMELIAQKYDREFSFGSYISGQTQSYVRTFERPKVELVEKGVWDVTVVATRTHARGDSIFAHEIFNHVIRVQAIKPDAGNLWGNQETHLGKLFSEMQEQGLQIIDISEF